MNFSKHQKQIIKLIASREIYDIQSYLKYFKYGKNIKYDLQAVDNSFSKKYLNSTFYRAKGIKASKHSTLSSEEFKKNIEENIICPSEYDECELKVNYDSGIQKIAWKGKEYIFNFYEGVYVANNFENILDFLILWEYLKSQMLILEVNNKNIEDNIGLLFCTKNKNKSPYEQQVIDYSTLTISDSFFINDLLCEISHDNLNICEAFLDKKIIPSVSLDLFIKNKFKSQEELIQIKALWVAWIAIFVSILLSIVPVVFEKYDSSENEMCLNLCEDVTEMKDDISNILDEQKDINNTIKKSLLSDMTTEKEGIKHSDP